MIKFRGFVYRAPADGEVGDATGGGEPVNGEDVVGTGNEQRLAILNQIADSTDESREEELAAINDDGSTEPFKAREDTPPKDEEEEETTPPADGDESASQKIKIKVNGRELELTQEELIERAQKIEAADEYLRQAAETKKRAALEAEEPRTPAPTGPTPEEVARQRAEEDRALVRAIQVGTEEEAIAALAKLRQSSASPAVRPEDIARTIDQRLAFNSAIQEFSTQYKEIWADPRLKQMAMQRDADLLRQGDNRSYAERYTAIGEELRGWLKQFKPASENPQVSEESMRTKEQKKASAAKPLPKANAKAPQARQEEEEDEDASSVIASMREKRGGPQWMRG